MRQPRSVYSSNYKTRWNKNREEWVWALQEHFGDPHCSLCGKKLVWRSRRGDGNTTVRWDHKDGHDGCMHPSRRFMYRKFSKERFQELLNSGYGVLCNRCNGILPTDKKQRLEFLKRLTAYIKGGEVD